MTMATAARPSAAHIDCLIRNRYGLWFRSCAIMADALYTMTTLANTSSSVAKNSTLSDFSLSAILTRLLTAPGGHHLPSVAVRTPGGPATRGRRAYSGAAVPPKYWLRQTSVSL